MKNSTSSDIRNWTKVTQEEEGRWIESRLRSIFFFQNENEERDDSSEEGFDPSTLLITLVQFLIKNDHL